APAALDQREPRRVVPAVLEAPQSLEQERRRLPRPRVAYDAAHTRRASSTSSWAPPAPPAPDGASAISRMIGSVFDGRTWSQRSRHASRRPSCVSALASGNRCRSSAYTRVSPCSPLPAPRPHLALTIVYRAPAA